MKANLKYGTLEDMVLTQWIQNIGLLKIADISLDEPELEVVLFYPKGNVSI